MKVIAILEKEKQIYVRLYNGDEYSDSLDFYISKINEVEEAIKELEELQEKVKVQDDLLKQYVKKEFDGVVAEIGEVCTNCDNYLKDRTIFYDGRKVMICNFCKFNNVSYFKEKEEK